MFFSSLVIVQWNIRNIHQFSRVYCERKHRVLLYHFLNHLHFLSNLVHFRSFRKEDDIDITSLIFLFINTTLLFFLKKNYAIPSSFGTIKWHITLERKNHVSVHQTNMRIHVIGNWKMVVYIKIGP